MYSKEMINNYILIDKVYGNYIRFQKKLSRLIQNVNTKNKNLNILEIGCGTGITTEIIKNARSNIKLTSIDIDINMINYAKENLSQFLNIKYIESDALTFLKNEPAKTYDIVVSAFTIHNFSSKYRFKIYSEIHRVLKDNCIFMNADKFVSDNFEMQINSLKYRIDTYIETLLRENKLLLLKEWVSHYIVDQYPSRIMRLNEEKKRIGLHFRSVNFSFKSEYEMLAIIVAKK